MANLAHLFKVGQKVKLMQDDGFDGPAKIVDGIVKETYEDHIIVATEDCDHMWYEEGLNIDRVYPDYNF